jgi:uncharacterized damage-inducible protein DinB
MTDDLARHYVADVLVNLRKQKALAEGALAQVPDDALDHVLDRESNSLSVLVRHIAGNMRSRWTDFFTTDGEKPDRNRDAEFEAAARTRAELLVEWEDGWRRLFDVLESLAPADLTRRVALRGEQMSVLEAIDRALVHYSYHVGQIVLLAKHLRRGEWRSLSIPRRRSRADERDAGGALGARAP